MESDDIRVFSLFEIGKDRGGLAYYVFRLDRSVQAGTPVNTIIDMAKALAGSREAEEARRTGSHRPDRFPDRPHRDLDIYEGTVAGSQLYAFHLNAQGAGQQRLHFQTAKPFLIFPLNSTTGEEPIEVPEHGVESRFASFIGRLGALRGSPLGERIKGGPHPKFLRIPFYFNVTDPNAEIAAAPWVHSDHRRDGDHPVPAHSLTPTEPGTHGGVHLQPMAMLSVAL